MTEAQVCYTRILDIKDPRFFVINQSEKGKFFRKHSLHVEKSSFGFIEAVHQWKCKFHSTDAP